MNFCEIQSGRSHDMHNHKELKNRTVVSPIKLPANSGQNNGKVLGM